MNAQISPLRLLTCFSLSLALATSVSAQTTNFWQGTVGTTTQWGDSATWSLGSVPDNSGAIVSFVADFTGTATAVNIAAGTNYTVGVINMTDTTGTGGKFNIASGTGGRLTLDNGASKPIINFTTGGQFDNFVNVILAGTNGLEKTGGGIAQISGASNAYTGVTKITGGGLRIIRNNNLGDATVGSGIELAGGTLFVRPDAGNFSLDNAGSANRNVSVTAGTSGSPSRIQVEGASSVAISGNFSSVAGSFFRKTDTGTLVFSGTANAIGRVEFDGGTGSVTGNFTNTEGVFVAKNNAAGNSSTLNWSGTGSVATGLGSVLLLNDGGTNVTNSTLNVTGGTLNVGDGVNGGRFTVGGKGIGVANVSGGTLSVKANKEVSIGSFFQYGGTNGNGTLNISNGGVFQALGVGNFYVGYGQTAAINNGNTNFGGTGVLNLRSGGTLETGRSITTGPSASGTVNFDGGIFKAAANNANWLQTTNNLIGDGGLTVDTAGFNVGISSALSSSGAGGLIKVGAGTLTLAAANAYLGNTTVNEGTLAVNNTTGSGTGSGALTVNTGATLTGTGTVGSITVSGTIAPGSVATNGVFTSTGSVSGLGTALFRLYSNGVSDRLVVSGGMTLNGIVAVDIDPSYTPTSGDSFDLVDGEISGAPTLSLPALNSGLEWVTNNFTSTGVLSITNGDAPTNNYASWVTFWETSSGGTFTNTAGTDDPDGDGFVNNLEFAFDGNPTVGTPALMEVTPVGTNAVFSWIQRKNPPGGVTYAVQKSTALTNGWSVATGLVITNSANTNGILIPADYERKEFEVPASGKDFYRVQGTINN